MCRICCTPRRMRSSCLHPLRRSSPCTQRSAASPSSAGAHQRIAQIVGGRTTTVLARADRPRARLVEARVVNRHRGLRRQLVGDGERSSLKSAGPTRPRSSEHTQHADRVRPAAPPSSTPPAEVLIRRIVLDPPGGREARVRANTRGTAAAAAWRSPDPAHVLRPHAACTSERASRSAAASLAQATSSLSTRPSASNRSTMQMSASIGTAGRATSASVAR